MCASAGSLYETTVSLLPIIEIKGNFFGANFFSTA